MDLALFFILPLIGGFAFATGFDLLRYTTGRQDSQRLYYRAAMIGVMLAGVGAGMHFWLSAVPAYAAVIGGVTADFVSPLLEKERSTGSLPVSAAAQSLKVQVLLACIWGFALGVLTPVWNRVIRIIDWLWMWTWLPFLPPRSSFLDRLNLNAITDQMERLITRSLLDKALVQITLNNSKVYVGSVLESLNPASPAKYFKIQPWMSGQRSSKDGRVEFNTFYDNVLAGLGETEASKVAASFQLVVPIDKVATASGFSLQAYEQFELERLGRKDQEENKAKPVAGARVSASGAVLVVMATLIGSWMAGRRRPRANTGDETVSSG